MTQRLAPERNLPGGPEVWHRVSCASYGADLEHLEALCDGAGSILDLGSGSGRVALHLARLGVPITAVDTDQALLDELDQLSGRQAAQIVTVQADVRDLGELDLDPHDVVIAPMQLLQILGGPEGRSALLTALPPLIKTGGCFITSLIEPGHLPPELQSCEQGRVEPDPEDRPLPDCFERDGWLYASVPTAIARHDGSIWVETLRQAVSPAGELTEADHIQEIEVLSADQLEAEAESLGLRPRNRIGIDPTHAHSGSTIVVLEPNLDRAAS